MLINSKIFGEVEIADDKVVEFENGIIGFEAYKKYALIYDSENDDSTIMWLQSADESSLAFPVINPFFIKQDYNPLINDELLESIGKFNDDEAVVLLIATVPQNIKNMTVNLEAPIIINANNRKAVQVIVENEDYAVRYAIYYILAAKKAGE
ncbi:MAG: flagellar assembly protein FliW [Lachnospiraceae bacterium]|nr:flagellar assembly protein FliW [Lachnospiraceae bacterium]